ncbi:unnamed protein product, partial [Rotaria sp. Silwood2]
KTSILSLCLVSGDKRKNPYSIEYSSKSIMKNEAIETAQIIDDNSLSDSQDNHDDESLFDYLFNFDWLKQLLIEEYYILEYSIEYGFLRLSPE